MTYFVIGVCVCLLLAVVYISAKPISMGIEARRNLKDNNDEIQNLEEEDSTKNNSSISEELIKLNKLKEDGIITFEEYERAKKKDIKLS